MLKAQKDEGISEFGLSGQEVKELRLALGLPREDFANLMGVSYMSIRRWEASDILVGGLLLLAIGWVISQVKDSPEKTQNFLREVKRLQRMSGRELRKEREDLKLSQTELARHLGVSLHTIHRYETGKVDITGVPMIFMAMAELRRQLEEKKSAAA